MDIENVCCFSGHRPNKLPWGTNEEDPRCIALKAQLDKELEKAYSRGYRHFMSGMALGADMYFCEGVLALRKVHPDVTLEATIPCEAQADYWNESERNRYYALVEQCNFETIVQHEYTKGCMLRRNRYMVDRSSLLITAFDGRLGGTMYTVTYAIRNNVQVVILDV